MEEDKDLERFRRLHEEYEKQRNRMIDLIEIDCKKIGTKRVAKNLHMDHAYIYRLFTDRKISYEQIRKIYIDIQEFKQILKVV